MEPWLTRTLQDPSFSAGSTRGITKLWKTGVSRIVHMIPGFLRQIDSLATNTGLLCLVTCIGCYTKSEIF